MKSSKKNQFIHGLKRGLPIAMGYLPVSFTFGLMAVNGGLPLWMTVFISLSNVTSAGQFAGTKLILAGAGYLEITLTTFVINIRYMLMSLSLSQKLEPKIPLWQRLIFGFGITDETFLVASSEPGLLTNEYMLGLISTPILGWTLGTLLGGLICSALPEALSAAMGIALYSMFIAILVPPAKASRPVLYIILVSVATTLVLRYLPLFSFISSGFRVIIATIVGAAFGAYFYPVSKEESHA
jgi:predicted branched-subunit amino acid permease